MQRLYGSNLLPAEHDQSHAELDTYNTSDKTHSPMLVSTMCKGVAGYVSNPDEVAQLRHGKATFKQRNPISGIPLIHI